ncbi:class I SAM-dependent methyltransferase [soil metagenome]
MARHAAAQTALGPMVLSAVEFNEAPRHRLVDDDLAVKFLPAGMRVSVVATRWPALRRALITANEWVGPGTWAMMTGRKHFIDDHLTSALNSIDAVVILGAGLDTRGYRLARYSDLPVFEVDQDVNIVRKAAAVRRALGAQPTSVHLVAVDFERDDLMTVLEEHGYHGDARTFFIWEGVTQYLTPKAVRATMDQLSGAAAGSRLVFTYVCQDFIEGRTMYGNSRLYRRFRERSQLWKSGLDPATVAEFLGEFDWQLVEQTDPDYYQQRYLQPAGRTLTASALERTVYAEKVSVPDRP